LKKILITGGTGFIGSHLTEKLLEEGNEITVLAMHNPIEDIENENLELLRNIGVKIVFGDLRSVETLEKAVKGNEVVVHLAAISRPMNISQQTYYDINEKGTINLLETCNKYKIKKIVHVSSVSVLGLSPDGNPLKEDDYQDLNGDDYGLSKLKGEKAAIDLGEKFQIPLTVIRPALVYGPRCVVRNIMFKFVQNKFFPLFGNGEAKMEFCYVDNLVCALIQAISHKYNGEVFNITDGKAYQISEVLNAIADNLQVNRPSINLPVWLGEFLGLTSELLFKVIRKSPPFSRTAAKWMSQDVNVYSCNKAIKVMEYTPKISLNEGVVKSIKWYREKGFLK
jgi:nucleoside-diphosphate-sugar epimerase